MSVRIEVNALGFDPGEGGAVPSRTTIDVKVQFLRSKVNCVNKLNHFIHGELGRYASNGLISRRPWVRIPDHGLKMHSVIQNFIKVNRLSNDFAGSNQATKSKNIFGSIAQLVEVTAP